MTQESQLLGVAAALYQAAVEPTGWPAALSAVGNLVDSRWSLMGVFGRADGSSFIEHDAENPANVLELFATRYNQPETNPSIGPLMAKGEGAIILREHQLTDRQWLGSDLYRSIYRPQGLYHGLGACVLRTPTHVALLGANREPRAGRFAERDLALLRQALPHVRRALEIRIRLENSEARRRAHEHAWNALDCGVILLDDSGRVAWTNAAAAELLACADGLALRADRLVATSPAGNAALQAVARDAVATGRGLGTSAGGSLSLARPSGRRRLALVVSPLRGGPSFSRRPCAAVFVTDPEGEPRAGGEALRSLYGLTEREAALADALLRGMSIRDAAAELGVSMNTARTFLRFVLRKTATRRQAELVALMVRSTFAGSAT